MKLLIDMQNLQRNAQVSINSLADLSIGHSEEFAFLGGKSGRFLISTFLKFFKTYCILKVQVDSTQMRIVFSL